MKKIIIGLKIIAVIGMILIIGQVFMASQEHKQIEQEARQVEMDTLKAQITELKNKPEPKAQIIEKTVMIDNTRYTSTSNEPNLAAIVAEWTPRVGGIVCMWEASGTVASGSFTLNNFIDSGAVAMTNRHVLADYLGFAPNECTLFVGGQKYTIPWSEGVYQLGDIEDYGWVNISGITVENARVCKGNVASNPQIGDKIVILGYPGVGATNSITATEGIISGFDDNYYVTSAKIEHGNSGGAAILLKDNCYLGIPSAAIMGDIESMGRILRADFVIKF